MLFAPRTPALRRWRLWSGALLVAEIGWFALTRPPFSGHLKSVFLLALIPLAVIGYVYLLAAVAAFLEQRDFDYQMKQVIVVMLGLSVGFFVSVLSAVSTASIEASVTAQCPEGGCDAADSPSE